MGLLDRAREWHQVEYDQLRGEIVLADRSRDAGKVSGHDSFQSSWSTVRLKDRLGREPDTHWMTVGRVQPHAGCGYRKDASRNALRLGVLALLLVGTISAWGWGRMSWMLRESAGWDQEPYDEERSGEFHAVNPGMRVMTPSTSAFSVSCTSNGNERVKMLPLSTWLSTVIAPPWRRATSCTIANPSPE